MKIRQCLCSTSNIHPLQQPFCVSSCLYGAVLRLTTTLSLNSKRTCIHNKAGDLGYKITPSYLSQPLNHLQERVLCSRSFKMSKCLPVVFRMWWLSSVFYVVVMDDFAYAGKDECILTTCLFRLNTFKIYIFQTVLLKIRLVNETRRCLEAPLSCRHVQLACSIGCSSPLSFHVVATSDLPLQSLWNDPFLLPSINSPECPLPLLLLRDLSSRCFSSFHTSLPSQLLAKRGLSTLLGISSHSCSGVKMSCPEAISKLLLAWFLDWRADETSARVPGNSTDTAFGGMGGRVPNPVMSCRPQLISPSASKIYVAPQFLGILVQTSSPIFLSSFSYSPPPHS